MLVAPEEGCWSLGRQVGRTVCTRSVEKLLTLAVLREASGGREGSGLGVRRPGVGRGQAVHPVVRSTAVLGLSPGSSIL